MSTERLLQIKDQIDEAKTQQAEIKGKLSGVREQMQTNFEVKDLPAAEKKLEAMGADLDKMETQFNTGMEELETAYDWETPDCSGYHIRDMLKRQHVNAEKANVRKP